MPAPHWIGPRRWGPARRPFLGVRPPPLPSPVPGVAGNCLGNRLREAKRVVNYQIKCRPFADLTSKFRVKEEQVGHLTNEVDGRASIKAAEIVKHARIPAVFRERATPRSEEVPVHIQSSFPRENELSSPSQVVAIEGERECSEVAKAEDRGIQLIESLVIESFGDKPSHVLRGNSYVHERAGNRIALNQLWVCTTRWSTVRKGPRTSVEVGLHQAVRGVIDQDVAQINVVEVGA